MPRSGEPTRQKILDAAEQVITERGVDAATFAEINARADQRNNSAAQYHFGDRVALLEAVVDRHTTRIAAERHEAVTALAPGAALREVVGTLVDPLARRLGDESGRRYLIIQASLLSHPDRSTWPDSLARPWTREGVDEVAELVSSSERRELVEDEAVDLKREMASLLLFHALANRARGAREGDDHTRFLDALVTSMVAVIQAEFRDTP